MGVNEVPDGDFVVIKFGELIPGGEELSILKEANRDLDWPELLRSLGEAHLGPAYLSFLDWVQTNDRPTAKDFFDLGGRNKTAARSAADKIRTVERPDLYGMTEEVLGALKGGDRDPARTARSLRALLKLDVLEIDAWLAFPQELRLVSRKSLEIFFAEEKEFSERISRILLSVLQG